MLVPSDLGGYGRRGDGTSRPRPVAYPQGQLGTGNPRLALPLGGHSLFASVLRHPQSSGAIRSPRPSLRAMGTGTSPGRLLAAKGRQCAGDERALVATPLSGGTR